VKSVINTVFTRMLVPESRKPDKPVEIGKEAKEICG
jgi:hypothetical protein